MFFYDKFIMLIKGGILWQKMNQTENLILKIYVHMR